MISNVKPARCQRVLSILTAIGLGTLWLCVESLDAVLEGRAVDGVAVLGRFLAALPWQLGFFLVAGLPAFVLRWSWRGSGSFVLGIATFVFFMSLVGEGLLKDEGRALLNASAWIGAGIGFALAPWILAQLGRGIHGSWRRGWVPAVWVAWLLAFVPALDRSAASLAFARMPPNAILFDGYGLLFALAAAASAFLIVARPRLWPIALLVLATRWAGSVLVEAPPEERAAGGSLPNVIVLVVDTLRADHLSIPGLTPNIDAFLSESVRFERAISPANQTLLAMPGVMTSLSVNSVGSPLSPEAHTMAEHLRDAGYATIGVSANPLISARAGYSQGFDRFSDSTDWLSHQIEDLRRILALVSPGLTYRIGISSSDLYYRPASEIRRRAVQLAAEQPRPVFLYLHTMDMHGPYLPPRPLLGEEYRDGDFLSYFAFLRVAREDTLSPDAELEAGIDNLRARYRGELRFTDQQLGQLFDDLRTRGLWDESLIWILSDHGESFGERGFSGHGGSNTTPSVQRVPLAMKPPASWNLSAGAVESTVSTFDILPTTLALLGLPPLGTTAGTNLTPWIEGGEGERNLVVASVAGGLRSRILSCFDWPWQLDVRRDADGTVEYRRLYNLEIDPEQRIDLSRAHPRVVKRLDAELTKFIAQERQAMIQTHQTQFDDQTLHQLRRLGYIE